MSNELERVEKLAQLKAVIARALARDRQGFGSCNFPRDLAEEIAALTPTPQVVEKVGGDITPTTEDVGDAYARARIYLDGEGEYADPSNPDNWNEARGEFDRWLATATGNHRPEMRWHNNDDPSWHESATCTCGIPWPHPTTVGANLATLDATLEATQ